MRPPAYFFFFYFPTPNFPNRSITSWNSIVIDAFTYGFYKAIIA